MKLKINFLTMYYILNGHSNDTTHDPQRWIYRSSINLLNRDLIWVYNSSPTKMVQNNYYVKVKSRPSVCWLLQNCFIELACWELETEIISRNSFFRKNDFCFLYCRYMRVSVNFAAKTVNFYYFFRRIYLKSYIVLLKFWNDRKSW